MPNETLISIFTIYIAAITILTIVMNHIKVFSFNKVVHGWFQHSVWARLVNQIKVWNENRMVIRHLNSLPDRLLQDIGIERESISKIVAQPRTATAARDIAQPHREVVITENLRQVA